MSNNDFLYLSTKIFDVNFREENGKIIWNSEKLQETTDKLKDWIFTENESAEEAGSQHIGKCNAYTERL